MINSLLCWSVTLLIFIQTPDHRSHFCKFGACQKGQPAGRILGDFGNFWTVSQKAHDWSFWILNECSLSWIIVRFCIISEVCMINTAPHSTVSPQMWCIKSIKDLLARFCKVNLSNAKNSAWFVFQEFIFQA